MLLFKRLLSFSGSPFHSEHALNEVEQKISEGAPPRLLVPVDGAADRDESIVVVHRRDDRAHVPEQLLAFLLGRDLRVERCQNIRRDFTARGSHADVMYGSVQFGVSLRPYAVRRYTERSFRYSGGSGSHARQSAMDLYRQANCESATPGTPPGMRTPTAYPRHARHRHQVRRRIVKLILPPAILASSLSAHQPPATPQPFFVGNRLGLPINPAADGAFEPMSPNVKVFGAIYSAESCSYDAERGVIVVPNRGAPQTVQTNNGWVSFINHDGSVHTARWIGVQNPADRSGLTPPLVLNEPYGSDIANGMLYVADRDGGTTATEPSVAVVRKFDMKTGAPAGETKVEKVAWFNDLEVADNGTIYATVTGAGGDKADPATWQVWKIAPDGASTIFIQGAPLRQPNGIAFDPQNNIVVVNIGNTEVLTFSPDGKLLKTENAAQAGNDGLVIMPDGTKYVSSVVNGGVSRMRPNQPAELIARNIPNAASMCYDAGGNQLVIPMNPNNGLAFVPLK